MTKENLIVSIWNVDDFADRIAKEIGQKTEVSEAMQPDHFRNGEFNPKFNAINPSDLSRGYTSTGNHVYIVAAPNPYEGSPQELVARVVLAASAAKNNGASEVTVVIPDLIYGRADRSASEDPKLMGGKSFSLEAIAQMFAFNVDNVLTLHPHSVQRTHEVFERVYSQMQKNSEGPILYILNPVPVLAHLLISQGFIDPNNHGNDSVMLMPDDGARVLGDELHHSLSLNRLLRVYGDKTRFKPNDPDAVQVRLDQPNRVFDGKKVYFIDDIIDTGGTLVANFQNISSASRRICYFTHPHFGGEFPSQDSQERLMGSNIDLFILGNTHPDRVQSLDKSFRESKVVFIDYVRYFADAILNCVAQRVLPSQHYVYGSRDQLMQSAGSLYKVIDNRVCQDTASKVLTTAK